MLRAGFGTTIVPFPDNRYAYNFPVKQTNVTTAANSFAPAGKMANGFGPPDFFPIPDSGIVDASIPQLRNAQLFYVQPDLKEAKLHTWNVAFQRQLPWNLVGEVAYVGNVGRGIILPDYNMNAGQVLGADRAGQPYFQLYGRTAEVRSWLPTDTSYNSLQAKLDRRFRNGFMVTTSYTLAKAINYSGETDIDTPADIERSKGRADFDRTHVFASSFIWDMPFFKAGQERPRLDPRRLADQRDLHRVLREPGQLHGQQRAARAPRTTRSGRPASRATRRSSATSAPASSTSTRRRSPHPRRTPGAT